VSWEAAAALGACLVLPGLWGWLVARLFRRKLEPLIHQESEPVPAETSLWDYQI
jgi:hypothetical protein